MSNDSKTNASPAGLRVVLLQFLVKLCGRFANILTRPIAIKRLSPIQIPFSPGFRTVKAGEPAARKGNDKQTPDKDKQEDPIDNGDDEFVMPGGSAGWGPVSGGYWGLDGQFHTWTGVPPLPPPPPLLDNEPTGNPPPVENEAPDTTTPEEEAAAEEQERRIRELEDEMDRILEEMQIMWPLLEDFLKEEFEARRREILELDPDWHPPGFRPPRPDEDDAPPLEFPEDP